MKYTLGYTSPINGSIDPLLGFEISDDLQTVEVISSITTLLGSRISQTENLLDFLRKNPDFYVSDSKGELSFEQVCELSKM